MNVNQTIEPKISIIVPVFNAEKHLLLLLSSLLNQSEPSFEVIAVDDGSTDQSPSILERMARQDPRIIVLRQHNQGVSAARNTALKHARGRWIAFADSDDWADPAMLATWIVQAETSALDFLVGNGFRFTEAPNQEAPKEALLKKQQWQDVLSGRDWVIKCVEQGEWPHYVWLQFIRREFIEKTKASFPENMVHEDVLWTLSLALQARRIGFASRPVYGYRINRDSIMYHPSQFVGRARSYVSVIHSLATIASECNDKQLGKALLRHANQEAGHLLGLLRKKIHDPHERSRIAQSFFKQDLAKVLFRGAENFHDFWRALRCWLSFRRFANAAAGPKTDDSVAGSSK